MSCAMNFGEFNIKRIEKGKIADSQHRKNIKMRK